MNICLHLSVCVAETRKITADRLIDWNIASPLSFTHTHSGPITVRLKLCFSSSQLHFLLSDEKLTETVFSLSGASDASSASRKSRWRLPSAASTSGCRCFWRGTIPSVTNEGNSSPESPRAVHPQPRERGRRFSCCATGMTNDGQAVAPHNFLQRWRQFVCEEEGVKTLQGVLHTHFSQLSITQAAGEGGGNQHLRG